MKIIISSLLTVFLIVQFHFNVLAQSDSLIILWEKEADAGTMQFTPDGNILITGGRNMEINCYPYTCGQIRLWEIVDGTILNSIGAFNMGQTNDIDISSNGQNIISGNGSVYCSAFTGCSRDRAGQFEFNINGSQNFANTNPDGIIYSIAFSPDNTIIAAGTGYNNSGHINIYDSQYNLLRTLPGHSGNTSSLLFTPDGQYLISGGADGSIRVWNYNDGSFIQYLQHGTYLNGGASIQLSISSDGQYLSSTGDGYNLTIKIWKISDWSVLHSFGVSDPYGSNAIAEFTPNGIYLGARISYTSNQDHIRFYKVETGELVREYIDTTGISWQETGLRALAFSPTANNNFAYSIGISNFGRIKYVATDLDLVENPSIPVELASFNASVNNNDVVLNWVTASEINNSGFEVQRKVGSLQSTVGNSDFKSVGFIEGNGTTTETNHYSFIDEDLNAGKYSYRLKQIDFDGTFEYSHIIEAEINLPVEFSLSQNYPNPFNPSTTIEYQIPSDGFVSLTIYNSLGQEITTLVNENQSAGKYSLNFSADKLPSGLYFYTLRNGDFKETKKMLLLK